ncbi:MAG: hypothetical protein NC930_00265 [Candidatus Omnitrophica bacterium]|nr:hypothetical protein [Candidatus Omnitrophota bacterium]
MRAFLAACFVILISAVIYNASGLVRSADGLGTANFLESLYVSIITYTTVAMETIFPAFGYGLSRPLMLYPEFF